jgi:hypothetical protein
MDEILGHRAAAWQAIRGAEVAHRSRNNVRRWYHPEASPPNIGVSQAKAVFNRPNEGRALKLLKKRRKEGPNRSSSACFDSLSWKT